MGDRGRVIAEPRATQEQRAKELRGYAGALAAGSLGRLFRRRAEAFPQHRGYLRPDAAKIAAWQERLAAPGPGLKIGLSWIGGLQKTGRSRRSLTLEQLRPVLQTPGVSWVSLQYTNASAEIAACGTPIAEHPGVTDDLDELAARIRALAREHNVPLVENVTLARALYATAEVGDVIPAALFGAVAEVLAYLVRLKQLVL